MRISDWSSDVCSSDLPLGRVAFDNVSFSYSGDRINLQGVTLDAPVPRRIALVGPSGSGKSTVINLLSRNYDVMSGSVMLNDTDKIGRASCRERVCQYGSISLGDGLLKKKTQNK